MTVFQHDFPAPDHQQLATRVAVGGDQPPLARARSSNEFALTVSPPAECLAAARPQRLRKSSTLRLIPASIPDPGPASARERDITALRGRPSGAMVSSEAYALYPHLSVPAAFSRGMEIAASMSATIRSRDHRCRARAACSSVRLRQGAADLSAGQRSGVAPGHRGLCSAPAGVPCSMNR